MSFLKKGIKIVFITYLLYTFLFSIVIFSFNKPFSKKDMEEKLSKPLLKKQKKWPRSFNWVSRRSSIYKT